MNQKKKKKLNGIYKYSPCWAVFIPQIIGDPLPPPPEVTENESVTQSPTAEPMS